MLRLIRISLLLIFFSLVFSSCKYIKSTQEQLPSVQTIEPSIRLEPLKLHYIGIVKSVRNVTIKARVDGYLKERYFKDGEYIKKDQLLYRIDERPYQAQLLSAQGGVDKSTADLAFQEIQYKRYQELLAKKSISKTSFDQQYASYLSAKGQLEMAQGDLEKAKINLDFCRIRSPLSGLAGKTLIDPGNLVNSTGQSELLNIVQLDPIRIEFNPAAWEIKLYLQYQKNAPYPTEVHISKFPHLKWNGVVDFYNNVFTANSSTILLRTTVRNQTLLLRPDLFVDVYVTIDPKHSVLYIPVALVKQTQGLSQVRVVDKNNFLQIRKVSLGAVSLDQIEIIDGIQLGDQIVVGDTQLPMGTLIKPIPIKSASKTDLRANQ